MGLNPSSKHSSTHTQGSSGHDHKDKRQIRILGDLFSILGKDPAQNIHAIVRQTCAVFDCACSLYNRLDAKNESLTCWAGHNLPPDFPTQSPAKGHICYEATIKSQDKPVILEDIFQTPYQLSDPSVVKYHLKSYLGFPVLCNHEVIGSLAVVDTRVRQFDDTDIYLISTLAKAVSLEEERLCADAALSQSESEVQGLYKMLRLMADNVPDLIWAKDMEDRYLFGNQAMCEKLLKCSHPDEAMGKTSLFFAKREKEAGHHHTFGENCINSDDVVKKTQTPGRFLEDGLVRNQYLMLDVNKAPFWGPEGEIIGTVGCGRDVTKEKQTELALKKSDRLYRDLYNNTPVMLCSMDRDNLITSASNLFLATLDYARDAVIGRNFLDFFAPESQQDAIEISLPEFYRSGQMKSRPFEWRTSKGTTKNVLLSAVAQKDDHGQYDGALAFAVDVTEARKTEMERNRLSARLQQAQKMEAIATLAGGIAHQFNNALAVILGNLELIHMDGMFDAKLNIYAEPINQASQKMVQLTGQLLAYARGGKFQTQNISAHRFVVETLKIVQHSMAPHMKVETDLSTDADGIEVDLTQMQMLLAAILANASEAMEKQGRVRVTLKNIEIGENECAQRPGLKPGRRVLLQISDNGKGMDEQTRDRIFEPFFTTKFQGRGLGMAAVYGIVKKHNGYVYVDSVLGQGTTVSLYLPGTKFIEAVAETNEPYISKRSGTALIVEDEHLVMEVNHAIIEKLGYQALEAKTGKEAVAIAQKYPGKIDFTLLDVILPDMDGSLIYPELMAARPDMKVIVCSGFSLDGPASEILDAGAESYIQKPFTVAALSAVLKKIFKDT
jgi:two-component system cell cycle sensor histidine kinase/response regulator CckA